MPLTIELARTAPARRGRVGRRRRRRPDRRARASTGRYLAGQGFEAKKGDVRALPGDGGTTTYVVGLGPAAEVDAERAALRRRARWRAPPSGTPSLAVDLLGAAADGTSAAAGAQAIAEGLVLGGYQFSAFKSEPKPSELSPRASSSAAAASEPQDAIARGAHPGRGGVLGARPRERARRVAHPHRAGQAGGRGRRAAPASRSRCGTRRRSASRSSAASSA